MASTLDDSLLDFDLNFLCQPPKSVEICNTLSKADKVRKAVFIAKKKTVATDTLIRKYYEKKELLDQTERELLDSKEECRQICLDNKSISEKYKNLEQEVNQLRNANEELLNKFNIAQSQCGAIQCHANQLQTLVKDYESQIETMKVNFNLEISPVINEHKNKIYSLKTLNEMLVRHVHLFIEVALGKKKLDDIPKETLKRYRDVINDSQEGILEFGSKEIMENAFKEDDYESPESPLEQHNEELSHAFMDCKIDKTKKNPLDFEEVVSIDTGRGSSLALSDNEKCFHSPDYYMNDSPLNVYRNKPGLVSIATSPITVPKTVNIALSPIQFEKKDSLPTLCDEERKICSKSRNKGIQVCSITRVETVPITVSTATSPLFFINNDSSTHQKKNENSIFSPLEPELPTIIVNRVLSPIVNDVASPDELDDHLLFDNDDVNEDDEYVPLLSVRPDAKLQIQHKECLERNNSNRLCDGNNSDHEVETILHMMKFKHNMITPIPATPVKIQKQRKEDVIKKNVETTKLENVPHPCNESMLIREENKLLQASVAQLAKEVMDIKCILKNKLFDNAIGSPNIIADLEHIGNQNIEHENTQIRVNNLPSPASTEVIDYACDDEPLDEPIEVAVIIEEDSEDGSSSLPNKSIEKASIHERLQFEDEPPIVDAEEYSRNDDMDKFDDTGPDLIICNYEESSKEVLVDDEKSKKRKEKTRRLTRLEKLRQRLVPKGKISENLSPLSQKNQRLLAKNKNIHNVTKPKKIVTESDNSSTLNDKEVYEKALKVMAELKTKQNHKSITKNKTVFKACIEKDLDMKIDNLKDADTTNMTKNNSPKEDSSQKKEKRRGRKRGVEVKSLEEQNKRILRSSVRQSISETPLPITAENTSEPSPQKKRKISVSQNLDAETKNQQYSAKTHTLLSETKKGQNHSEVTKDIQNNHSNCKQMENLSKSVIVTTDKITSKGKEEKNKNKQYEINNKNIKHNTYNEIKKMEKNSNEGTRCNHPKDSILCLMIENHAHQIGKRSRKTSCKDSSSTILCQKITDSIAQIVDLPNAKAKLAMDNLVAELRNYKLNNFLAGLMKYMQDPSRKVELFKKLKAPPAPPMTKAEQIVIYLIVQLNNSSNWRKNVINCVLDSIEFVLFQLNQTPTFDVIESMSHFYAVLCRYTKAKSRLRLFVMDAMYCIQFKAIPLIKQCMDVWMHILPLSHMGIAKSPLVTCLVYLLHFYKCEDKFNRVSELRHLLQKKYFFDITEWNDTKILEMLRSSIKELRDILIERKMMRIALIIVAKRLGARWCHENIIKKLLLPLIEREAVSDKTREFCVSMLGPLLKPYPADMKAHCEIIVNQLLDMLEQNPSTTMEEAIFTSLIYINKHNPNRITKALTTWNPHTVSPQLEELLKDFVKTKPVKTWKFFLSKLP